MLLQAPPGARPACVIPGLAAKASGKARCGTAMARLCRAGPHTVLVWDKNLLLSIPR